MALLEVLTPNTDDSAPDTGDNVTDTGDNVPDTDDSDTDNDVPDTDDDDECAAMPGPCDANAVCTNTDGSFECTCKVEYTGNGRICSGKVRDIY